MQFICKTLKLLVYFSLIECTFGVNNGLLTTNSSIDSQIDLKPNQTNESDLLVVSSWTSLKYWTSNSRLHSSKVIENFEVFHSNVLENGKIAAIDFYTNQTNCQNVLIWCELKSQTIYSSLLQIKNEKLCFTESTKLLQMNFGTHIRLAVDFNDNRIYLSLFDFSRIDVFDIQTKSLKTFLTNVSHPVDIAIDNNRHIVFWIENRSCIAQTSIDKISIVRMCSVNARALAVDTLNGELFWSDSLGRIFRRKYFQTSAQMVFAAKKMNQNNALYVTTSAIYLSDRFKLTAINRSTLSEKVVLIESPGILVFKSISRKHWCKRIERKGLENDFKYNSTVESNVIKMNSINRSLTLDLKENSENNWFGSDVYIIIISILIIFSLILLLFMAFKRFYKKNNSNRTQIKRISGRKTNKFLFNDKNKLLSNGKNVNKTVCIEDLGSFSNNGYLDPQVLCSNCPIRQTCSSCDDKEECLERGICLTTYKLLS